jgi:hypothetical protein
MNTNQSNREQEVVCYNDVPGLEYHPHIPSTHPQPRVDRESNNNE